MTNKLTIALVLAGLSFAVFMLAGLIVVSLYVAAL